MINDTKNEEDKTPADNIQTTTRGYDQYISPRNKNKRIKLIFITILSTVLVLIIMAVVIFIVSQNKDSSTGDVGISRKVCADNLCFEERFRECLPTEFETVDAAENKLIYKLNGDQDVGCITKIQYDKNLSIQIAGKEAVCDLDNELEFKNAKDLALTFPSDFECKGNLIDTISNL